MAAVVIGVDEAADGDGEVCDRGEAAAADGLAGDDAEEDLHHVQPRAPGRREMQRDPRVVLQPGPHGGVLVGPVVIQDDVQAGAGVGGGDLLEEPQELLVAVPGVTGVGGDLPGGDLQGGEQGGGAVALVVVGAAGGQAGT